MSQASHTIEVEIGADSVADWLRETLEEQTPGLADSVSWVDVLRAGPKRLAIVALRDGRRLALKQYPDQRGALTNRWLRRLTAAGFTEPSRFRVTSARGWSPARRTLLADVAPGSPWSEWVGRDLAGRVQTAVAAAEWLLALQRLPVSLEDRSDYRSVGEMRGEVRRLAVIFPDRQDEFEGIRHDVAGVLAGKPVRLVPSHGDLHPQNLWILDGPSPAVTALDLDTAGFRRPSYDVGYAVAMLLVSSWMNTGDFRAGADLAEAFWNRWLKEGQDAAAVPAEVARALVQSLHFELVTYRTGELRILPRWLRLARAALDDGIQSMLSEARRVYA
ncbi:MAG: phosphotransferase [Acidobacteriota bacterium]|nr:phosphotransferase [Acidobacteriota bacterium]